LIANHVRSRQQDQEKPRGLGLLRSTVLVEVWRVKDGDDLRATGVEKRRRIAMSMITSQPRKNEGAVLLAPAGGSNGGLSIQAARRIAERAHEGQVDANGEPYISHVGRVAASVPSFARPVAWLHDVLERTDIDESALTKAGASEDQCLAVRLLSRGGEQSDDRYLNHVRAIGRSPGPAGRLARVVKIADLLDHLSRPAPPSRGWTPPYGAALALLMSAGPGQSSGRRRPRPSGSPRSTRRKPEVARPRARIDSQPKRLMRLGPDS
jgi:hypothetical protein